MLFSNTILYKILYILESIKLGLVVLLETMTVYPKITPIVGETSAFVDGVHQGQR